MSWNAQLRQSRAIAEAMACPLCGGHAGLDIACGHCFAPAEVIAAIRARGRAPRFVGVMGPSGVGKTVYLGMLLDLLARGAGGLKGLSKGAYSLALHRNLILALERQRFPEKTPSEPDRWQWAHCEVRRGRGGNTLDVITPDVAGEAVSTEVESPRSNATVRAIVARCSGLVVLTDILQVIADGQGQELFAMQLINYLDSLRTNGRRRVDVPVAIVFTKADLFDEPIGDPEAFARSHAPALTRLCAERLRRVRFFCSGVAGSCARLIGRDGGEILVPLRVEPRGVVEPFAWLMTQLR